MLQIKMVTFLCCFIQPADIQEIEKVVDEALALAAENHALLDHIHEVKAALDPKKMHTPCRTLSHLFLYKKGKDKSLKTLCFVSADSDDWSGRTGEERASSAGDGDKAGCRQGCTCCSKVVLI